MKDKIIKILEKNASYYNQMEMAVSEELFTDVADEVVKLLTAPAVSISLVDTKFMKWLAKNAPELCESLYNCIHDYETNEC